MSTPPSELDFFAALQDAMDTQAREVWQMVHASRAGGHRLRIGEVTLTELSLFRLGMYFNSVGLLETTEPNEAATGADWEWLIGQDDRWLSIRVQAKILGPRSSRSGRCFDHLDHVVSGMRQMDRLITPTVLPVPHSLSVYALYAAGPPVANFPPVVDIQRYGCSVVCATEMRNIHDNHPLPSLPPGQRLSERTRRLLADRYVPVSSPWSGLFDGLVTRLSSGESMKDVLDDLASMPFQPSNPFDTFSTIAEFWKRGAPGGARGNGPSGGGVPSESRDTVPGYALPIIEKARTKKSPWLNKMVSDREDDDMGKDRLLGASPPIADSERLVVAPNVERSRMWREVQRKSGEVESWEQVGEERFIGYSKSRARGNVEGVATHVVIHPDVEDLPELVSVIDTSQFGT